MTEQVELTDDEIKAKASCFGEMWDPENEEYCIVCPHQQRCLHILSTEMLAKAGVAVAKKKGLHIEAVTNADLATELETTEKAVEYAKLYCADQKIGLPIVEDGILRPRLQVVKNLPPPETEAQEEVQELLSRVDKAIEAKAELPTPLEEEGEDEEGGPDPKPHKTHSSKIKSKTGRGKKTGKGKTGTRKDKRKKKKCGRCGRIRPIDGYVEIPVGGPICDMCNEETEPKEPTATATTVKEITKAPEPTAGLVANLTTGAVERAEWGAFPPLIPGSEKYGGLPFYQLVFWSVPLNKWVYLVAGHTGREFPVDGDVVEMTLEELRAVEARSALGLGPDEALKAVMGEG